MSLLGRTSGLDQREMQDILDGKLVLEHRPLAKTIRVFVSSDYSDSKWERRYLRETAVPRLRRYCQSLGLQFHTVDLHQDLFTATTTEPNRVMYELEKEGMLLLALKEIKLCQSVSAGASFVTFLAQKYGHKPLPLRIAEEDFKLICAAVDDQAAKQLVHKWYRLDLNALPREYVLQPFQSLTQHSGEKSTNSQWESIHASLSKAIRRATKVALGKDPAKVQKYTNSATEEEVTVGIFNLKNDPNQCSFWFKRTFFDLVEQRPSDHALPIFTDIIPGKRGPEFDIEATKTLNHLKEARMPAKYVGLDATNIFEFSVKWQKNKGLEPHLNPTHSNYLNEMCEKFNMAMEANILEVFDHLKVQGGSVLYQEVLCQGAYCRKRMKEFVDRKDITMMIESYLKGSSDKPLVIHGVSGSGKTSVMAAAAYYLRERNAVKRMSVIVRFLGTTPHSSSIRHTLQSICEQITFAYKVDNAVLPGDYKGIAEQFEFLLHKATEEKPIYIFLDAVDQLSPEDGASGMSWLPLDLPSNVKVVLSTSSEVQYRCYPVLQSILSKHKENFVEAAPGNDIVYPFLTQIPPLTPAECKEFLTSYLASVRRQLTDKQEEVVLKIFHQCSLPLYFEFLKEHVVSWKSYTEVTCEDLSPPEGLKGMTEALFHKLEEQYGVILTSNAIAYITAAKHGLSETELLDILACDSEVMKEVNQRWGSDASRLSAVPPLLWSKIFHGLSPFLELRVGCGGILVLRWSHRQLEEVASSCYLSSKESTFSILVDYFSGKLSEEIGSEQNTPHTSRGGSPVPLICVADQPLFLNAENQLYNIRKLIELPYCLAKSGRYEELKKLLTDFDWVKACIHTTSCADLINDFTQVVPVVPFGRHGRADATELRMLREALTCSIEALTADTSQLCTQLLGRLLPLVYNGDERPLLKQLVYKALEDAKPSLTPLQPFFHIPGNPLLVSMQGHRDLVSCIATTITTSQEGETTFTIVSSSWDKTLKSWDLASTGVLKTFDGHTDRVLSVALSSDGQYAVSGASDATVRHWYVPTGHCLHTMRGHSAAVNAVVVTTDGCKAVSCSSDSTIKVWNTNPTSSSSGELIFTMKNHHCPVFALALSGDKYLASGAKNGVILITNIISGEVMRSIQGHGRGITALATTDIQSSVYLLSGSVDGSMKVWDFDSGEMLYSLYSETTEGSSIKSIAAGPNGKAISTHGDKMVSVWDLLGGTHLYNLLGHVDAVCSTSTADEGSLAVTGSADCTLSIWDLDNPPVSQTTHFHSGAVHSVVISPCGTFGLSAGSDSTVMIYELNSMKVVRNLQGHSNTINHVYVLRDSRRILTASSDATINLWDGETGDILQIFKGHEDVINCLAVSSDSELLMSGSEDAKVIFWSLKTGKKLKTFTNHASGIISVSFVQSLTAHYIVSASRDGNVCIRDFYSAKILLSISAHTEELFCVSASPNCTTIATGSADKTAQVFTLPEGTLQAVLSGHQRGVRAVKFLPDCENILTGSEDKTLRIWNICTRECLACLHTDAPVLACDISRNMTILYGTDKGWVSTASYQANPTTPDPVILRRLQGMESPSQASSFTDSQSSFTTHSSQGEGAQVPTEDTDAAENITAKVPHSTDVIADAKDVPTSYEEDQAISAIAESSDNKLVNSQSTLHDSEVKDAPQAINGYIAVTDDTRKIGLPPECEYQPNFDTHAETQEEKNPDSPGKSSACILI